MKLALAIAIGLAAIGATIPLRSPKHERFVRRVVDYPPLPPTNSVIRKSRIGAKASATIPPTRGRLQDFRYQVGFNRSNYWGYLEYTTVLPPKWRAVEPGVGMDGAVPSFQADQPVWPTNAMMLFRMRWTHK